MNANLTDSIEYFKLVSNFISKHTATVRENSAVIHSEVSFMMENPALTADFVANQ